MAKHPIEVGRTYRILEVQDGASGELVGYRIQLEGYKEEAGSDFARCTGYVEKFPGRITVTARLGPQQPVICNCARHHFPHRRDAACAIEEEL
jgi:hypothetical protein